MGGEGQAGVGAVPGIGLRARPSAAATGPPGGCPILKTAPCGGPSGCVCPTCPAWSGSGGRSCAVEAAPPPALPAGPWGGRGSVSSLAQKLGVRTAVCLQDPEGGRGSRDWGESRGPTRSWGDGGGGQGLFSTWGPIIPPSHLRMGTLLSVCGGQSPVQELPVLAPPLVPELLGVHSSHAVKV